MTAIVYLAVALVVVVFVGRCLARRLERHRDPDDPWAG